MNSKIAVLTLSVSLASAIRAAAQGFSPVVAIPPTLAVVTRDGIPASDSELTTEVQASLSRGDMLTGMRRYGAAEQEYQKAARIARRQGYLPSMTTFHLASARYFAGDLTGAAEALDRLSAEAAKSGDVVVEALALYNAAWLNARAGRANELDARVAVLRKLLRSPYIPPSIRDHIIARLGTQNELAGR